MRNPHLPGRLSASMMGGLGMLRPTAPRPALPNRTAAWLQACVASGAMDRVDVRLSPGAANAATEAGALSAIARGDAAGRPVALFATGHPESMHWHGSAGAWLHDCFYQHRLARAGGRRLPRPPGTAPGRYIVAVHVRHYESPEWNLPGPWYVSAVRAIFDASPLDCSNSDVVAIGDTSSPVLPALAAAFGCTRIEGRSLAEPDDDDATDEDEEADGYYSADDDDGGGGSDDARRNNIFLDLEVLGLSDFMVASNSEFSALAQSLSSPHTVVLCPPRRPGAANMGLPCNATGTPNSILTNPAQFGIRAVETGELAEVDGAHVRGEVERAWRRRSEARGPPSPLWDARDQGMVAFNISAPVEASWPDFEELWGKERGAQEL